MGQSRASLLNSIGFSASRFDISGSTIIPAVVNSPPECHGHMSLTRVPRDTRDEPHVYWLVLGNMGPAWLIHQVQH